QDRGLRGEGLDGHRVQVAGVDRVRHVQAGVHAEVHAAQVAAAVGGDGDFPGHEELEGYLEALSRMESHGLPQAYTVELHVAVEFVVTDLGLDPGLQADSELIDLLLDVTPLDDDGSPQGTPRGGHGRVQRGFHRGSAEPDAGEQTLDDHGYFLFSVSV